MPQFGKDSCFPLSLLKNLRHRNVIKVFDLGVDQQGLYFVFEYIQGPTLAHIIKEGPMPLPAFFHMAFQVLEGLGAAHRKGLLHLDIKPANIMLHKYPEPNFTAKVLDFGLAKVATEMSTARKNEPTIGSVYYISPEQLNHYPLQPSTDLYSLGHVFYHAICTRVPFHEPDPLVVRNAHLTREPDRLYDIYPYIPIELSDWIHQLMEKDPEARPQTTQYALASLTHVSLQASRQGYFQTTYTEPSEDPTAPLPLDPGTHSEPEQSIASKAKRTTNAISGFLKKFKGS
ncbi:MAG: serine/threonine-protein kinase [Verrucomicrobiota bacterium]